MPEPEPSDRVTETATASEPSIGILVVAYNAATTLAQTLDRIPDDLRPRIRHVLVSDDESSDETEAIASEYAATSPLPVTVVRQPVNLGYGGNQQFGYRWMIDAGVDVVVLLHGDGQYAPERLGDVVAPFADHEIDVVLGSRMLDVGGARRGGMPLYKFVGNRILSTAQNALTGLHLSEWHSGYRAFRTAALARIPFERNSADFDFDTEVLLQFLALGATIREVPIPTYYGDEICHVDGLRYARDVMSDVTRYRLGRMGFGSPAPGTGPDEYEWKDDPGSSHQRLLDDLLDRPAGRALDLGCGTGELGRRLVDVGWEVVGVDLAPGDAVASYLAVIEADLERDLPPEVAEHGPYDVVIAADVLEHVRRPDRILDACAPLLTEGGAMVASIPNVSHWYPRARAVIGRFDYDERGILDRDHVRFFTRRSIERLAQDQRWSVERLEPIGLPFDVADRGAAEPGVGSALRRTVGWLDDVTVRLWPSMFAYQYLAVLTPR
ncbi:MAG: glycosyltransferase [Actinomycetota bacterium]